MATNRINARLSEPLANHVERVVGRHGLYETPSEYIRSLIRRDMESSVFHTYEALIEGIRDAAEGRLLESSGDWEKDKQAFLQKENEGWK